MLTDTLLERPQIGKKFIMKCPHTVMCGVKTSRPACADQNGRAEKDAVDFDNG